MAPSPPAGKPGRSSLARPTAIATLASLSGAVLGAATMGLIASLRGTGASVDAYYAASSLPNLAMIVLPPAIAPVLVPLFAELEVQESEASAWGLASRFLLVVMAITGLLTGAGMLAAPLLARWLTEGEAFAPGSEAFALTVRMLRIQLPNVFLSATAGVLAALHYSHRRFVLPSLAPLLNSGATLICALLLWPRLDIVAAAAGSLLGPLLQVILMLPILRQGFRWPRSLHHPGLSRLFRLQLPIFYASSLAKIEPLIEAPIATSLADGNLSILRFAAQITSVLTRILGGGIAVTFFPELSAHRARRDTSAFRERFSLSVRYTLLLTIPATVGLISLRQPLVALLLQRGAFDVADADRVGLAIIGYATTVVAAALAKPVTNGLFAYQDTRGPALISTGGTLLYLGLALGLPRFIQPGFLALALAASLSKIIRVSARTWLLRRHAGALDGHRILRATWRMILASLPMAACIEIAHRRTDSWLAALALAEPWRSLAILTELSLLAGLGAIVYGLVLLALGAPEARGFASGMARALGLPLREKSS